MLKHSEACERNKEHINKILKEEFTNSTKVLEIGSGTGQHAVYFGNKLPHLTWCPSDLKENIKSLIERIKLEATDNVKMPIEIDVSCFNWELSNIDAVFSANTFHIMSSEYVEYFFEGVDKVLINNGLLCIYGPFKYYGTYTSESNEKFDKWLKERNPESGIKDFEKINELAVHAGLRFEKDYKMPANNQCIIWKKTS